MSDQNQKVIPSDCPICALRPVLYISQINLYQAKFFCEHSTPPATPHFQPSLFLKIIALFCNFFLIYGVYHDLNQLSEKFSSKHVIIFLEVVLGVTTVIYNTAFLLKNQIKLQEIHGMIAIIKKKGNFSVTTIISEMVAKKVHSISFYFTMLFLWEEFIMLTVTLALEDLDQNFLFRIFDLEVLILITGSLGLSAVQSLCLYENIFDQCYHKMEMFVSSYQKLNHQKSRTFCFENLQKQQRFYMCLRRNYKLLEEFFQPSVLILFSLFICLLMIGYEYYVIIYFTGEVGVLKFDVFLIFKSLAVSGVFVWICFKGQKISTMNKNILSSLFKCPFSRMSFEEAAQIEMLISTLTSQKLDLKSTDILTIGTGLLVSISGTVVTYILVALQFHAAEIK